MKNPTGYNYSISATIEQNEKLKFINDTRFIIMDVDTMIPKESIDFFVIEVKRNFLHSFNLNFRFKIEISLKH